MTDPPLCSLPRSCRGPLSPVCCTPGSTVAPTVLLLSKCDRPDTAGQSDVTGDVAADASLAPAPADTGSDAPEGIASAGSPTQPGPLNPGAASNAPVIPQAGEVEEGRQNPIIAHQRPASQPRAGEPLLLVSGGAPVGQSPMCICVYVPASRCCPGRC